MTYETDNTITEPNYFDNSTPNDHDHAASTATAAELDHPSEKQDEIAQQMWDNYLHICDERATSGEDQSEDEDDEEDDADEGEDKDKEDKDEIGYVTALGQWNP